jgi:hypothetical protein
MIKHFYYIISGWIEENKFEFVSYLCAVIAILIAIIWPDISRFIPPGNSLKLWNGWMIILLFVFFAVEGISWIIMKKAPIFIIPIRGIPAIILGLILSIGSLGVVIWAVVINLQLLAIH